MNIKYVDKTILEKMKDLGLTNVQFVIENGSDDILKYTKKGIAAEECYVKIKYASENDINVLCSFIIGFPSDSKLTVNDTIEFDKKLKRLGVQIVFSFFIPFPGSVIYDDINKNLEENIDYSLWINVNEPIIKTKFLNKRELRNLYTNTINSLHLI